MKPFSTGINKKIDNLKFKEALNRELTKHVLSILNAHVS